MKKLFPLTQLIIVFLFFCASTFGQGIKGKVIDADIKEGIVGATVSIENSSYSTSTDLQGNYSLKIPKGDYKLITFGLRKEGYPHRCSFYNRYDARYFNDRSH